MDDERLAAPAVRQSEREGLPVAVGLLMTRSSGGRFPRSSMWAPWRPRCGRRSAPVGKSSAMVTEILQAARTYPPALLRFFLLDFGGGADCHPRPAQRRGVRDTARAQPGRPHYERDAHAARRAGSRIPTVRHQQHGRPAVTGGTGCLRGRAGAHGADHRQLRRVQGADVDLDPAVERILVEGANFGLHVQLTSSRWGDVSARKLDQIANRIELKLNDPSDSSFGRVSGRYPDVRSGACPGLRRHATPVRDAALGQHGEYGPLVGAASSGAGGLQKSPPPSPGRPGPHGVTCAHCRCCCLTT